MDKLYTVEEVSSILNVGSNTIRIWLRNGNLQGIKINKSWRIKEADLKDFIEKQEGK